MTLLLRPNPKAATLLSEPIYKEPNYDATQT